MHQRGQELRGHLRKKTRHGRWRRRWFETSGCHLAYFKAEGGQLLAALNLPEVGEIAFVGAAASGGLPGLFTIELNERVYSVRADDDNAAQMWVSELKLRQAAGSVGMTTSAPGVSARAKVQPKATATATTTTAATSAAPAGTGIAQGLAAAERDSVSLVANADITGAELALRPATPSANRPSFGCPRCAVQ